MTESLKQKARRKTRVAIRAGKLHRLPCEVCGASPAEAHHNDYGKPLDVRWFCRPCHRAWHMKHAPGMSANTGRGDKPMRVLGYVRVSTGDQAESAAGLAAQRATIQAECSHRGLELLEIVEDAGWSAKTLGRPGIASALERLRLREADALMVAKLDRLSRSMLDFVGMLETARKQDWAIITLDMNVDTSTTQGRMIANVLATFAQFERELISDRTKAALAARKAAGQRLGRPLCIPAPVRDRIITERSNGRSFAKIAARLNAEAVPTAHGGSQWWPSTVRAALQAA